MSLSTKTILICLCKKRGMKSMQRIADGTRLDAPNEMYFSAKCVEIEAGVG